MYKLDSPDRASLKRSTPLLSTESVPLCSAPPLPQGDGAVATQYRAEADSAESGSEDGAGDGETEEVRSSIQPLRQ